MHSDKVKIDVIPSNTDLIAAEIALIRNGNSERTETQQ
jgi:hypothetical protein